MASYDEALQKMYSDRLTRFYRNYDEAKVASVPTLLQKYKGKEEQLLAAMVKKYGPEPEPDDDAADASPASHPSWYMRGGEQDALSGSLRRVWVAADARKAILFAVLCPVPLGRCT